MQHADTLSELYPLVHPKLSLCARLPKSILFTYDCCTRRTAGTLLVPTIALHLRITLSSTLWCHASSETLSCFTLRRIPAVEILPPRFPRTHRPEMDSFAPHPPQPLLTAGEVVAETWTVQNQIGTGRQGQIFRGTAVGHAASLDDNSNVAIKILNCRSAKSLLKERDIYANIGARLPRNQFPRVYFCGMHNQTPVMVMDLLSESVLDALTGPSPPNPATLLRWTREILHQLCELHALGRVHYDVHLENIMIGRPGTELADSAFLIDFGMACAFLHTDGSHNHSTFLTRNRDLANLVKSFSEQLVPLRNQQPGRAELSDLVDRFLRASKLLGRKAGNGEPDYDKILAFFI